MSHRSRAIVSIACFVAGWLWLASLLRRGDDTSTRLRPQWVGKGPVEVLNSTLGFQKILVINLPSRTDRRDAMALAGAVTNLTFDWVAGVSGDDVPERVLPADSEGKQISTGNKGSWRAHMNALRRVVELNLTSALILEDDADWDIRLKTQLQVVALASRGFLRPAKSGSSRPLAGHSPEREHLGNGNDATAVSVNDLPAGRQPSMPPYGDHWDVLWLGHCGTDLPSSDPSGVQQQPALVTIPDDETVPPPAHLRPHPFARPDEALRSRFPPHTRVVHRVTPGTACSQAYAVSQRGARRLLWLFGTETMTTGWDFLLRHWRTKKAKTAEEPSRTRLGVPVPPVCLAVQPPVFGHHYGKGGGSDITAPGGGYLGSEREMTPYVRLSVRMNLGKLARGDGISQLADQWPEPDETDR
ncbi:hypothetical protein VTK73DRAFT_7443 [Phialemonium thermophilum]|uniref:Glycosyl transferase family 25 domain-containing protein n=1 Tax=Phialemonium thermophilum TaxID=223376 RepID=A0ABR3WEQ0_9PEZI